MSLPKLNRCVLTMSAGRSDPAAAIGRTTVPMAGSVARSPETHATAATSPATTDTAFANERSRPSGVTTFSTARPVWAMSASGSNQWTAPAGRRSPARLDVPRPAVTGHKMYAASPYRATTVTWSKIIGLAQTRVGCPRAAYLTLRQLSRTPGAPMFDNLSQRLSLVVKRLRGEARLTDENIQDALREVRLALLEADVALPVVKDFVAAVKEKAVGNEV